MAGRRDNTCARAPDQAYVGSRDESEVETLYHA